MNHVFTLMGSNVKSLPETATVAEILAVCARLGYAADEMTDQIDIRRNGRKIAVYMA